MKGAMLSMLHPLQIVSVIVFLLSFSCCVSEAAFIGFKYVTGLRNSI